MPRAKARVRGAARRRDVEGEDEYRDIQRDQPGFPRCATMPVTGNTRRRMIDVASTRGAIASSDSLELLDSDDIAERDLVLAQLTAAAVCGQPSAEPERPPRDVLPGV